MEDYQRKQDRKKLENFLLALKDRVAGIDKILGMRNKEESYLRERLKDLEEIRASLHPF